MSDGSFPHQNPDPQGEAPPSEEPEGARVIAFPQGEVRAPAPSGGGPVPAGTWADEDSQRASTLDRLLKPAGLGEWEGAEVLEFPRRPPSRRRRKPRIEPSSEERSIDASGTQPTQEPTPPAEEEPRLPEYLASKLLRRDWSPRTPLRRTLKWGSIVLGAGGAVGTILIGGFAPPAMGLAALFALCAVAGLAPLTPELRGGALATIGSAGLAWVGWLQAVESHATPLLLGCITITASALFFRASHVTSRFARLLVGVGLFATASWLVLTGGIDALVVETVAWQSFVGPASHVLLGSIALLAILSFLDPTSHGGAWVAGFALLGWLAVDAGGMVTLAAFPQRGAAALEPSTWIAQAALPLFAAVAAGGLTQIWVMISRRGTPTR